MTLFQYIIRILMGNSDTVFAALVMGVFGYMGWLLWKMNERLGNFIEKWNTQQDTFNNIKDKMDKIDEGVYKKLMNKLEQSTKEMDKLLLLVNDNNEEIERMRSDIITEVKESTNEIKDIIMILMNNRARSIKSKGKMVNGEKINLEEMEVEDNNKKKE